MATTLLAPDPSCRTTTRLSTSGRRLPSSSRRPGPSPARLRPRPWRSPRVRLCRKLQRPRSRRGSWRCRRRPRARTP
ncbi:hypothetical protein E8A74_35875 [Polyangium fumosum]|uniref:Uncharacterized protein n=1 Tax=Polyangium fumosum TaxID=889272 RepID=A0A4V5PNF3_9BACT|nr:hypothetical protein E8A74_35875 [Polyangium fumosum]